MNSHSLLTSSGILFIFLVILSFLIYLLNIEKYTNFLQYIDSACFFLAITFIFLFARKYMTQSYALTKHYDSFFLDAFLLVLGSFAFFTYFYISL